MPRISLTEWVQQQLQPYLRDGDIAIDATLGNGYDTVFLARHVGASGQVFGFDIQPQAIEATRQRLLAQRLLPHVSLIQACHSAMRDYIPPRYHGRIKLVMFNLGYLPGGDKTRVTQAATTVQALGVACELLTAGGGVSVMLYPGHAGGDVEAERVDDWLQRLDSTQFKVQRIEASKASAPRWCFIQRRIEDA